MKSFIFLLIISLVIIIQICLILLTSKDKYTSSYYQIEPSCQETNVVTSDNSLIFMKNHIIYIVKDEIIGMSLDLSSATQWVLGGQVENVVMDILDSNYCCKNGNVLKFEPMENKYISYIEIHKHDGSTYIPTPFSVVVEFKESGGFYDMKWEINNDDDSIAEWSFILKRVANLVQ